MAFLHLMRDCRVTSQLELVKYKCEGGRKMGFEPYVLCTALTSLTLTESELEFLPSAVLDLSNLTFLDLSDNKLQHFPDSCGVQLEHLETLLIPNNQLKSLPSGIGGLTALRTLALPRNALETLPSTIGKCTSLTHLDLRDGRPPVRHVAVRALLGPHLPPRPRPRGRRGRPPPHAASLSRMRCRHSIPACLDR